jgi:4-alpha-glucanotransferase
MASARISLALAIHNHQPVGNFGWVYAEVFNQAYAPMVAALERHPSVRLALHYSGPLLEWLQAERPDFIDRVRELVGRGQVELIGGGFFEPVLASLPERDRLGQLQRMADELERITGTRPAGAWLAERVWEPDLPTSIVATGYRWTILDDAHFRAAAIPEAALWGPYTTEDQGSLLTVFGTEQGLRYRIPFRPVEEVIAYLREHATDDGARVGMMGDDGEKFGAWPTTWERCWGSGRWVDRFFEALEANADWLQTVTPSAWLEREAPIGRVYVPTGSYSEMGVWALPPEESVVFRKVFDRAQAEGRPEARWLRGAFWRNFQVRYREINDLHKQMLRTSAKVAAMLPGPERDRAVDHLYRGQSNDCYWHGLFGGVYLSHMRLATFEHLIAAEDAADTAAGTTGAAELRDLDMDGRDEVLLADEGQVITVDLDEGAGIGSWDVRAVRHAVTAVMRRRPEAYHEKLRALAKQDREPSSQLGMGASQRTPVLESIHEIVRSKEGDLASRLHYDQYERRSGLVHLYEPDVRPADVATADAIELGDFVDGAFGVDELDVGRLRVSRDGWIRSPGSDERLAIHVEKVLTLGGDRLHPSLDLDMVVENGSAGSINARLGIEFATTMLGGGGNPAAWWEAPDGRSAHDSSGEVSNVTSMRQGNDDIGLSIATTVSPAADAWWSPIETVSNSESGFERVYQGSCLVLSWRIRLDPGERRSFGIHHAVEASRDRQAEESAALADPAAAIPPAASTTDKNGSSSGGSSPALATA